MSQENVEILKEMNAALNSGDVDEAMARYAPDAELRTWRTVLSSPRS